MKNTTTTKNQKIISMSSMTSERIAVVANLIKDKVLFADKIKSVKKTLSDLKALPI